jgi:hypothetical protein
MLLQTRWEQVEQLYHDNLVQAIGLRDCTVYQLQQLMASSKIVPSVISVEVHPFYKNEELVSFCKKKVNSQQLNSKACLFVSMSYCSLLGYCYLASESYRIILLNHKCCGHLIMLSRQNLILSSQVTH